MLDPVALPVAIPTNAPCIEGGDAQAAEAFGIALDEAVRDGEGAAPDAGADPSQDIAALVTTAVVMTPRAETAPAASPPGPAADVSSPSIPVTPVEETARAVDPVAPPSVEPLDTEPLAAARQPADAPAPPLTPAMAPAAPPPAAAVSPAPPPHAQIAHAIEALARDPRPDAPPPLSIRLEPADLGRVEVRIAPVRGGATRIEIVAERPETMALLQRDQQDLIRALDRAGFTAGEAPVFALADQRGGGASGRRSGEGRPQAQPARLRAPAATTSSVPARQMHRAAGRLDLIA